MLKENSCGSNSTTSTSAAPDSVATAKSNDAGSVGSVPQKKGSSSDTVAAMKEWHGNPSGSTPATDPIGERDVSIGGGGQKQDHDASSNRLTASTGTAVPVGAPTAASSSSDTFLFGASNIPLLATPTGVAQSVVSCKSFGSVELSMQFAVLPTSNTIKAARDALKSFLEEDPNPFVLQLRRELNELQRRPRDFPRCLRLIRSLDKIGETSLARFLREHAAAYCATTEEFWLEWVARLREMLHTRPLVAAGRAVGQDVPSEIQFEREIIQLQRRAITSCPTADLCLDHLKFLKRRYFASHGEFSERVSHVSTATVLRACERCLQLIGEHPTEGAKIWEFYRRFGQLKLDLALQQSGSPLQPHGFALQQPTPAKSHPVAAKGRLRGFGGEATSASVVVCPGEDSSDMESVKSESTAPPPDDSDVAWIARIRNLFYRQLQLPMSSLPELLDEIHLFESELPEHLQWTQEQQAVVEALYRKGVHCWLIRKDFEQAVTIPEVDKIEAIKDLSEAWTKYLDFEKAQEPLNVQRVCLAYLRACEDLGHIRVDLWVSWITWATDVMKDLRRALLICDRAVRRFASSLKLWTLYLSCQAEHDKQHTNCECPAASLLHIFRQGIVNWDARRKPRNVLQFSLLTVEKLLACVTPRCTASKTAETLVGATATAAYSTEPLPAAGGSAPGTPVPALRRQTQGSADTSRSKTDCLDHATAASESCTAPLGGPWGAASDDNGRTSSGRTTVLVAVRTVLTRAEELLFAALTNKESLDSDEDEEEVSSRRSSIIADRAKASNSCSAVLDRTKAVDVFATLVALWECWLYVEGTVFKCAHGVKRVGSRLLWCHSYEAFESLVPDGVPLARYPLNPIAELLHHPQIIHEEEARLRAAFFELIDSLPRSSSGPSENSSDNYPPNYYPLCPTPAVWSQVLRLLLRAYVHEESRNTVARPLWLGEGSAVGGEARNYCVGGADASAAKKMTQFRRAALPRSAWLELSSLFEAGFQALPSSSAKQMVVSVWLRMVAHYGSAIDVLRVATLLHSTAPSSAADANNGEHSGGVVPHCGNRAEPSATPATCTSSSLHHAFKAWQSAPGKEHKLLEDYKDGDSDDFSDEERVQQSGHDRLLVSDLLEQMDVLHETLHQLKERRDKRRRRLSEADSCIDSFAESSYVPSCGGPPGHSPFSSCELPSSATLNETSSASSGSLDGASSNDHLPLAADGPSMTRKRMRCDQAETNDANLSSNGGPASTPQPNGARGGAFACGSPETNSAAMRRRQFMMGSSSSGSSFGMSPSFHRRRSLLPSSTSVVGLGEFPQDRMLLALEVGQSSQARATIFPDNWAYQETHSTGGPAGALSREEIEQIERATRATWTGLESSDPSMAPLIPPITSLMSPIRRRSLSSSSSVISSLPMSSQMSPGSLEEESTGSTGERRVSVSRENGAAPPSNSVLHSGRLGSTHRCGESGTKQRTNNDKTKPDIDEEFAHGSDHKSSLPLFQPTSTHGIEPPDSFITESGMRSPPRKRRVMAPTAACSATITTPFFGEIATQSTEQLEMLKRANMTSSDDDGAHDSIQSDPQSPPGADRNSTRSRVVAPQVRSGKHFCQTRTSVETIFQQQQASDPCTLYISNLDRSATEADIRNIIFGDCPGIVEIRLVKDFMRRVKGYCYVQFESPEAASFACSAAQNKQLHSRSIRVAHSKPTVAVYEPCTVFVSGLPVTKSNTDSTEIITDEDDSCSAVEEQRLRDGILEALARAQSDNPSTVLGEENGVGPLMPREITIIKDHDSGRLKGYAYLHFESPEETLRALALPKNSCRIGNHSLTLAPSIPMKRHRWTVAPDNTEKKREAAKAREEAAETPVPELGTIFVKNLSFSTTEKSLQSFFETIGPVEKVLICRDLDQRSKGFGFVTFTNSSDAFGARMLNGSDLDSREIVVSQSHRKPSEPKPKPAPKPKSVPKPKSEARVARQPPDHIVPRRRLLLLQPDTSHEHHMRAEDSGDEPSESSRPKTNADFRRSLFKLP